MQLYGSTPGYTLTAPLRRQQPSIGEYRVLKPAEEYNLSTRLPFDCNWGRSDYLAILPLDSTLQANSDTFAAPNAVPLASQYQPLAYESWDPVRPSFLHDEHQVWKH